MDCDTKDADAVCISSSQFSVQALSDTGKPTGPAAHGLCQGRQVFDDLMKKAPAWVTTGSATSPAAMCDVVSHPLDERLHDMDSMTDLRRWATQNAYSTWSRVIRFIEVWTRVRDSVEDLERLQLMECCNTAR